MANQETQLLDGVIVSGRRKMLTLGLTSLTGVAAAAFGSIAEAASYTDADILNFALNLEYLEANFYYLAAFGTTIDVANSASTAAGAPKIALSGTVGVAGTVTGGSQVPFATTEVGSYATETAVEEGKHVKLLLGALGSSAVAQPAINLGSSFPALATAAKIPNGSSFSPYASDDDFLVGAYVFEDVGVTAYHGAAPLLTTPSNLASAAGILAVEAYHAGLIRTTINYIDPDGTTIASYTNLISTLRASLSQAALLGAAPSPYDTNPDDFGLAPLQVSLGGGNVTATRLTDADQTNVVAFARNTTQVLNIVTGGGAVSNGKVVSPALGVFFPNGMNAGPNGFK
jgi:Ferritin-like domain